MKLGGAARFGHKYVTTVRVGLGVQGSRYYSLFSPNGTGTNSRSDFVFDGLWYLGGDLSYRYGNQLSIGIAASTVATAGDDEERGGTIEIGVQV